MLDNTTSPGQAFNVQLAIIVAGAGLGELATALALRKAGHHVRVLEGSSWLRETGAAITCPPNATRTLVKFWYGPQRHQSRGIQEWTTISIR